MMRPASEMSRVSTAMPASLGERLHDGQQRVGGEGRRLVDLGPVDLGCLRGHDSAPQIEWCIGLHPFRLKHLRHKRALRRRRAGIHVAATIDVVVDLAGAADHAAEQEGGEGGGLQRGLARRRRSGSAATAASAAGRR